MHGCSARGVHVGVDCKPSACHEQAGAGSKTSEKQGGPLPIGRFRAGAVLHCQHANESGGAHIDPFE